MICYLVPLTLSVIGPDLSWRLPRPTFTLTFAKQKVYQLAFDMWLFKKTWWYLFKKTCWLADSLSSVMIFAEVIGQEQRRLTIGHWPDCWGHELAWDLHIWCHLLRLVTRDTFDINPPQLGLRKKKKTLGLARVINGLWHHWSLIHVFHTNFIYLFIYLLFIHTTKSTYEAFQLRWIWGNA